MTPIQLLGFFNEERSLLGYYTQPLWLGILYFMNLDTVQQISETLNGEPVIVMFSTGKDSIVMADLLIKGYRGHKEFVFLYFVPGLAIKQRIIGYYENRWNITIHQQPHYGALSLNTGKKHKAENENGGSYNLAESDYAVQIVFPNNREKHEFMRKIRKHEKETFLKSSILLDIYNHVYDLSVFGNHS